MKQDPALTVYENYGADKSQRLSLLDDNLNKSFPCRYLNISKSSFRGYTPDMPSASMSKKELEEYRQQVGLSYT